MSIFLVLGADNYAYADGQFRLLLPKMLNAHGPAKPRFVIVGSGAHKRLGQEFPYDDPNAEESASYPATKVLNHLFATALVRRSSGKVDAFSLSPGCELPFDLTFEWLGGHVMNAHVCIEKG